MNVLVFRTGQLGDSLISIPALHQIRRSFPSANIDMLYDYHLGKSYVLSRALIEGSSLIQEFIGYPIGYRFNEKIIALIRLVRLLVCLRNKRYDIVVHLEPELKTSTRLLRDRFFFMLAGAKRQYTTLQFRKQRHDLRPLAEIEHESDFFICALSELGFAYTGKGRGCYDLELTACERLEVVSVLGDAFLTDDSNYVAVGVGSKMQSKRWSLENYEEVLRKLLDLDSLVPVFFGGPEDSDSADLLIGKLGSGVNACGKLSLRGSARALQDCLFYLGNDTGTMHLAVAAGLKCVAIFSARDVPGKWYPYGGGHIVHRVAVDCEGCLLYECHEQNRKCLTAIGPEAVYASCRHLLLDQDGDASVSQ